MAVVIQTVSTQRFSIDGIQYFKNFLSEVKGNTITIYNAYDSRDELISNVPYTDFILNGTTYASASLLQIALLPVLYTRATLGAGSGINSVTGTLVNNTDPLNPVVNIPTKAQIGLGNVDNTSDLNKPISTATQTALNLKENSANKATTMTGNTTSNVLFLTAKAIYDWAVALFQPLLVSGTNIKTINGNSVLGAGDLVISGGGGSQNLQQVTDVGNVTTNPIVLTDANFECNVDKGVMMSCDSNAMLDPTNNETFIGCYDLAVGKYVPTRYSKRKIEVKQGDEESILKVKCGIYDGFDFQVVIHNTTISQKIHAKGSVAFNIDTEEIRYKIEYDNCTGIELQPHFRTQLYFKWDLLNNAIDLMMTNLTAIDDIYVNINANLL